MITQVTYERLFNLGNYESERISATATVESADIEGAYDEARTAVMDEFMRNTQARTSRPEPPPASYAPPPASDKQRNYISMLQNDLNWTSEQLDVYAQEQGFDLIALTKADASAFIDGLKALAHKAATEEGIVGWASRVVTPAEKPGTVGSADIPF